MKTGRGPQDADRWDLRACSAIPGRERWEVKALRGRSDLARGLEAVLARRPGVVRASANPVTGRILVHSRPDDLAQPISDLIRVALDEVSHLEMPAEAVDRPGDLGDLLRSTLPGDWSLYAAVSLSAASFLVHYVQGQLLISTVNSTNDPDDPKGADGEPRAEDAAGDGPPDLSPNVLLLARGGSTLALIGADVWVQYHRKRLWRRLGQAIQQRLRTEVIDRILRQDLAFFDEQGTGRLIELVTSDTARIGELVERGGDQLIDKGLTILVFGAMLVSASPLLAMLACLSTPFLLLPSQFLGTAAAARYGKLGESAARFNQMLDGCLGGIVDVKSFTAEGRETQRLAAGGLELSEDSLDASSVTFLDSSLTQAIYTSGFYLTVIYGASLVAKGRVPRAEFIRVLYLFPRLLEAVRELDELRGLYHRARSSAKRLAAVMASRPAIEGGPLRLRASGARGEVVFEDVSFGYNPSTPVLEGVSFRLRPGETLAIVGRTGSGKSTLIRLLMRYYEVGSGRILLDGVDVRDLDLDDLRSSIGLVGQDGYLFQGSVRSNVRYGRLDAPEIEVAEVLTEAGAPELLGSRPGELGAEVGERGRRLSGGERQRVAIARALLKGAPVLALDEVTSHLDYETEAAVKQSLRRATRGKSVIMVAHRLTTIRDADQILLLDRGRIVERGDHDDLVARGGAYASLWRLQTGEAARA